MVLLPDYIVNFLQHLAAGAMVSRGIRNQVLAVMVKAQTAVNGTTP